MIDINAVSEEAIHFGGFSIPMARSIIFNGPELGFIIIAHTIPMATIEVIEGK